MSNEGMTRVYCPVHERWCGERPCGGIAVEKYDCAKEQDRMVREHMDAMRRAWDAREQSVGDHFAAQAMVMHARAIVALMGGAP